MSDFTIRNADMRDVAEMMRIEQAGFPPGFHEPEEMFADIVQNVPEYCFVAENNQIVIGYLLGHPSEEGRDDYEKGFHIVTDTNVMFLHDLCVNPATQSKGVGRALYESFQKQCIQKGFSKIIGIAVGDAASYWQKLGFTIGRPYPYNEQPGQFMVKEI